MAVNPPGVRMAEIIAHAAVALDTQGNAMRWLQQLHADIAGRSPLDLLSWATTTCFPQWSAAFTPDVGLANLQEAAGEWPIPEHLRRGGRCRI